MVGKDQPPDLAVHVPSNSVVVVVVPELPNKTPSAQAPPPPTNVSAEKTKHVASCITLIFPGFNVSNVNQCLYK